MSSSAMPGAVPVDGPTVRRPSPALIAPVDGEQVPMKFGGPSPLAFRKGKTAMKGRATWLWRCLYHGCEAEGGGVGWQEAWLEAHQHEEDHHSPTSLWMNYDRL